jgi:competence protein ComFB
MAFIDSYNLEHLVNEAERLVQEELGRQLESYQGEICLCNDCVVDMAAMALNTVKPLYRYSLLGTLWTSSAMSDEAYAAGVQEAVTNAIEKVRANPSHD